MSGRHICVLAENRFLGTLQDSTGSHVTIFYSTPRTSGKMVVLLSAFDFNQSFEHFTLEDFNLGP